MRRVTLLFTLFLAACFPAAATESSPGNASSETHSTRGTGTHDRETHTDTAPSSKAGPAATPETERSETPSACDSAETARLQQDLDENHAQDTDAVLAVKTACGVRVLTSGPSKLAPRTLHRMASVTKTYTGAVVMTLVRDGVLGLEDPISRWVSVPNGDAITIRHLLTHTSGLYNYTDDEDFEATDPSLTWTAEQLVNVATAHPPNFAPGTSWKYSNTNYTLLSLIAEIAGRAPFVSLLHTRVLEPLGLRETFLAGGEPVPLPVATGLAADGREVTSNGDMTWAWGAGNIAATPADVLTWIEALGSGHFHDARTQSLVMSPIPTDDEDMSAGLGVLMFGESYTGASEIAVGHDGDITGFHSDAFYYREHRTAIVVVVDDEKDDKTAIMRAATATLFGGR